MAKISPPALHSFVFLIFFFFIYGGLSQCTIPECAACSGNLQNCELCYDGFSLINNACLKCEVQNCLQCSEVTTCNNCIEDYTVVNNSTQCACLAPAYLVNSQCFICQVQYCVYCSGSNQCQQCQPTFVLYSDFFGYNYCGCQENAYVIGGICVCNSFSTQYNGQCISCNIDNCLLCIFDNICNTCQQLFTLVDNKCYQCSVSNCTQCNSIYCQACEFPLTPNSLGSQCIICNISGCIVCDKQNECFSCQNGLQLNEEKNLCVECSIDGCLICESSNICSKCQLNFMLIKETNLCFPCTYPCSTCVFGFSYLCLTCLHPYSSIANSSHFCFTCSVPNCKTCEQYSQTCLECNDLYKLQNSNCVQACPGQPLCLNCSNENNICTSCIVGYAAISGICLSCPRGCISCDPLDIEVCISCFQRYYLAQNTCIPCPSINCTVCNENGCYKYTEQSFLTGSVLPGMLTTNFCYPQCLRCSNANNTHCLKCIEGYSLYFQDLVCIKCQNNCRRCNSTNISYCLSCFQNQFLFQGSCIACSNLSNCRTCNGSNLSQCYTCPQYYQLIQSGSLSGTCNAPKTCDYYCSNCQGVCRSCVPGYTLVQNICLPCIVNCIRCSSEIIQLCFECSQGYYLNNTDSSCYTCSTPNCLNCKLDICYECITNYTINIDMQCQVQCQLPCMTCISGTNLCTSCIGNIQLYNQILEPVCDLQYSCLELGYCFPCLAEQCGYCNQQNCIACYQNQCLYCNEGYYLENNNCNSCNITCKNCLSLKKCVQCVPGRFLTSDYTCSPCRFPCEECTHLAICNSCFEGYTLIGRSCISNINFQFSIGLKVNQKSFYSQFYNKLNSGLKASQNEQMLGIFMVNLTEQAGLFSVGGYISLLGSATASTYFQKILSLQQSLNSEDSSATILYWSIITNGIDLTIQTLNSFNVGLIIGILLPLVILFLSALGLLIYVFYKTKQRTTTLPMVKKQTELKQGILR